MTQQAQQEPAQPGGDGEDLGAGIRRLQEDVRATRERYRTMRDPSPKKLLQEMEGTSLSFFEDFLQYLGALLDYAVTTNDDLNSRVEDLEDDAVPPLTEEEGEIVLELADTCEGFVQLYTDTNPNAPPEVKKKLADAAATIARAREWIEERLGEDNDDEPEGGGEDTGEGINAPGGDAS